VELSCCDVAVATADAREWFADCGSGVSASIEVFPLYCTFVFVLRSDVQSVLEMHCCTHQFTSYACAML